MVIREAFNGGASGIARTPGRYTAIQTTGADIVSHGTYAFANDRYRASKIARGDPVGSSSSIRLPNGSSM